MQQQVMKLNVSSELGLGFGESGGWGQHLSALGSGSWTSTTSQESSSNWQGLTKTDSTSDAGDDTSSVKSGSTVTNTSNVNSQSQDSSAISTSAVSSSSPWSNNPTLSGMDSGPWGNSSSPAPTSINNSLGWNSSSTSNQGQNNSLQQGPSAIGSNINFSSSSSASGGWPSGSMASGMPPTSAMTSGNLSSQWPASSMLGKMGDFQKSDSAWNNPTSSLLDSKDVVGSDPRWGLVDKTADQNWEPPKSQWGNNPLGGSGDQGASNGADGLSFAQATLKGLKIPPAASGPNSEARSKADDILRAIENHEGWGSRPIRQDTSWEVDSSPKTQRKFQTDNSGASNVWNNSNGTAIWEAVRENQGQSNWNGGNGNNGGNSWTSEKEQQGWQGGPKSQDPSQWGVSGSNSNDSKSFGTWESGGAGDASNKMYGQKNAIGSWSGDVPNTQQRPTNISSWQDEGDNNSWEDPRSRSITGAMSTMQNMVPPSPGPITGMAGIMPQGIAGMGADPTPWNGSNPPTMNRTKLDEPWNTSKPPPTKIPGNNGWGMVESDQKVDDGTGIWAANITKVPKQAGAGGWGNEMPPQGQWNPKQMPPGGWDEQSYMIAQRNKQMLPNKFSSNPGNQPQPQMRAKALQQLMDMGFRKEEAQNALIGNNMDIGCAINELKSGNSMQRKDVDDMYHQGNTQNNRMPYMSKGMGNDMNDTQSDQVPNFSTNLPNTPFPNAQLSSQPFIQGNTNMPPSSLNPNSSISNQQLQHKVMQKIQQGPPGVLGPRGQMPPVGGANNNQALQQQQQQQQILSQLRQAVNNGYISPQLLNNPLPHNILVLLQHLLQLQQAKQGVMTKLQQSKNSPVRNQQVNQQLEQLPVLINNINQQINNLQKQLQQAQNNFFSTQDGKMPPRLPPNLSQQPPSGVMTPIPGQGGDMDNLSSDLASVSMNPTQSRLTNIWKAEASGIDGSSSTTASSAGNDSEDKSKGLLQASSSPNPTLSIFSDRTWSSLSTTSTSTWPMSSAENTGTNSQAETKSSIPSSTSTSSASGSGMPSSGLADMVPEFVPGKPWQGYTKNVEDDPHMTPSMIQRSLSVNKVHDESLSNLSDGHKITGGNMGLNMKNENTMFGHLGNRPPPNMAPGKLAPGAQQWQNNYQRQNTWGGRSNTSAFTQVGSQNWNDSQNSSWILLKHPNSSLDSTTLKALCGQHGNLINYFPQGQAALVQFSTRDQAIQAVQRLNNFQIGNSVIMAETIGENEAQRVVSQNPPPQPNNTMPQINPSQWSHAPPSFPSGAGMRNNDPWGNHQMPGPMMSKYGGGGDPWGGSGLWGDMNSMGDHNSSQMLNNILGSESM